MYDASVAVMCDVVVVGWCWYLCWCAFCFHHRFVIIALLCTLSRVLSVLSVLVLRVVLPLLVVAITTCSNVVTVSIVVVSIW